MSGRKVRCGGRPWGPDLRVDQVIGARVLWAGGDLPGFELADEQTLAAPGADPAARPVPGRIVSTGHAT